MKALKITLISLAYLAAGFGVYVGVSIYNTPKLVAKQGKKFTIRYKGKDNIIDAQKLHEQKQEFHLGGKWSFVPLYSNESDKAHSLSGIRLEDDKKVGHGNFYF